METKIMRVVQQGDVLTVQRALKAREERLRNATSSSGRWAENTKTPMQRSCSELQQN